MRAKLVTLSGNHASLGCGDCNYNCNDETMDGFLGDVWDVATAPFKGVGHMVMEAGRGISRGDIGRFFMSPIKGTGHTLGITSRATLRSTCTVSKLAAPGAVVPGPHQPYAAATAAASGAICGLTSTPSKQRQETIVVGEDKKKSNAVPIAIGVAGAAAGLLLLLKG